MAVSKLTKMFDERLVKEGILNGNYSKDFPQVHKMLNTYVRKTGKILSEDNFVKGDEALRKWLMILYKKGAAQEKLTAYLRSGLGHLCLDFVMAKEADLTEQESISRAIRSFKARKFGNTYFKVASSKKDTRVSMKGAKQEKKPKKQ
jgi:hypothetical protein